MSFQMSVANSSTWWGLAVLQVLWWTPCIYLGEIFSWWLTLTQMCRPPQGLLDLANSCEGFLFCYCVFFKTRKRILQSSTTVVFSGFPERTSVIFSQERPEWFWFFIPVMVFFMDCDRSLDFTLGVNRNRFQIKYAPFEIKSEYFMRLTLYSYHHYSLDVKKKNLGHGCISVTLTRDASNLSCASVNIRSSQMAEYIQKHILRGRKLIIGSSSSVLVTGRWVHIPWLLWFTAYPHLFAQLHVHHWVVKGLWEGPGH